MNTIQSKALIGIGSIGEVPILLAKPQTYMNFSGESVGPLAAYYRVPLRHILLVYDETSLPNGVLKLEPKGGHGHHNGPSLTGNANIARLYTFTRIRTLDLPVPSSASNANIARMYTFTQIRTLDLAVPSSTGNANIARMYSFTRVRTLDLAVVCHLDGSRDFPRLAIGIGNPPGTMDLRAFLLQKFSSVERKQVDESLEQGVQAVRTLVLNGFNQHINRFNLGQKYKTWPDLFIRAMLALVHMALADNCFM
ncbi:peptidyl-tRNA hydrolase family protein, partial [Trifolium pratense]